MGKKSKQVKTHRTSYRTLNAFLPAKKLHRKPIAKDGSCLFRAVAEQVYLAQWYHHKVRLQCVEYIRTHPEDFKAFITIKFDDYLDRLSKELWGGELELVVVSKLFGRSVVVYNEHAGGNVQEQIFPSPEEDERDIVVENLRNPILLAYSDNNHYDSVYTIQHMNNIALCQGMVYRLLFESVARDRIPPICHNRLDTIGQDEVLSLSGRQQQTQQLDRPLHLLNVHYTLPSILAMGSCTYHNAALEVHKKERESSELRDRRVAASIQFQVGDRCQFHFDEGDSVMEGEIVELNEAAGYHVVYVDGMNENWQIPCNKIIMKHNGGKRKYPPSRPRSGPSSSAQSYGRHRSGFDPAKTNQPVRGGQPSSSQPYYGGRKQEPDQQQQQGGRGGQTQPVWDVRRGVESRGIKPGVKSPSPPSTGDITGLNKPWSSDGKTVKQGQRSANTHQATPLPPKQDSAQLAGPRQQTDSRQPNRRQPKGPSTQVLSLAAPASGSKLPPVARKTNGGPGGSLTSDDSSYSSSDESGSTGVKAQVNGVPEGKIPAFPADGGKFQTGLLHKTTAKDHVMAESRNKSSGSMVADKMTPGVTPVNLMDSSSSTSKATGKKGSQPVTSAAIDIQNIHKVTSISSNAPSSPAREVLHSPRHFVDGFQPDADDGPPVKNGRASPYWEGNKLNDISSQPGDAWPHIDDMSTSAPPLAPPTTPPNLSNSMLFKAASMGQQQYNSHAHNSLGQLPSMSGDNAPPTSAPSSIVSPTSKTAMDYHTPFTALFTNPQSPPPINPSPVLSPKGFRPQAYLNPSLPAVNPSLPAAVPLSPTSVSHDAMTARSSLLNVLNPTSMRQSAQQQQQQFAASSFMKPSPTSSVSTSLLGVPPLQSDYSQSKPVSSTALPMGLISPMTSNTRVKAPTPSPSHKRSEVTEKLLITAYTQTLTYQKSKGTQTSCSVREADTQTERRVSDSCSQTEGVYVEVGEVCPPELNEDSEVGKLHFALQYSIKCLSAFVQHTQGQQGVHPPAENLQSLVGDLQQLEGGGLDKMLLRTNSSPHTIMALNASQQEFLQGFIPHPLTPGGRDIPHMDYSQIPPDGARSSSPMVASPSKDDSNPEETEREASSSSQLDPQHQAPPHPIPMYPVHPQMMMPRPPMMVMPPNMFYPPFMQPYPMPSYYPMPHPFAPHMVPPPTGHPMTGPNQAQSDEPTEAQHDTGSTQGDTLNDSSESSEPVAMVTSDQKPEMVPGRDNPLPPSVLPLMDVADPRVEVDANSPRESAMFEMPEPQEDSVVQPDEPVQPAEEPGQTRLDSGDVGHPGLPCRGPGTQPPRSGMKRTNQNRRGSDSRSTRPTNPSKRLSSPSPHVQGKPGDDAPSQDRLSSNESSQQQYGYNRFRSARAGSYNPGNKRSYYNPNRRPYQDGASGYNRGPRKMAANFTSSFGSSGRGSQDPTRNILDDFCRPTLSDRPPVSAAPCTSCRSFCGTFPSRSDADTSLSTSSTHCIPVSESAPRPSLKFEATSQDDDSILPALEDTWSFTKDEDNCNDLGLGLKYLSPRSPAILSGSQSSSVHGSFADDLEFDKWDSDVGDCLSYVSDEEEVCNPRMVVPMSSSTDSATKSSSQLVHGQCYVNPSRLAAPSRR